MSHHEGGPPFEIDFPAVAQAFGAALPGDSPAFDLGLHRGHPRLAHVTFKVDGGIRFELAHHYPTAGIRANMAARALAIRPLFAYARSRVPDLVGTCPLWLGDIPETSALAFCGNSTSHALIPDPDFVGSHGYAAARDQLAEHWIPWQARSSTLYWRGSLTGNSARYPVARWQDVPRIALCLKARESPLASSYDCALSGDHIQLRDRAALPAIKAAELFAPRVSLPTYLSHRFLIDIDGNSASWAGLFTKLMMGGTVLKVESRHGFRQWYYDRLQPWVNIVPVSCDLHDLDDIVLWLRAHPEKAEAMASNALDLSRSLTYQQALDDALPKIVGLTRASPPHSHAGERDGT